MSTTIKIAGVQMEPKLGDVCRNRREIISLIEVAAGEGAKLVVFPECALTGYGFADRREALNAAEQITPGGSVGKIAEVCQRLDVHAIVGLLERYNSKLYNACTLVGPAGIVSTYRKVHLPYLGVDRFADPGDRPFEVVEAAGIKIGMHICYDGAFPEPARVMTLLGAELIVLPTNWPSQSATIAEHLIACRAVENVVYAMAVNRVGEERGFRFEGRSSIADPGGVTLARAGGGDEIIYAEVEPARAQMKRIVRVEGLYELDRIKDRRPEFYGRITAT